MIVLPCYYLAPVSHYSALFRAGEAQLEVNDRYRKQTFRNRCVIDSPQGPLALSIPVEKPAPHALMRDIRISDHGNWRHLHWNALVSAYGESPFFEYYQDDIRPFFEKRWEFLFDFNEEIRMKMCELVDIQPKASYSLEFREVANSQLSTLNSQLKDYREGIRPKHPMADPDFEAKPYYQVYQQKHGFLANLSVLDLLFNMGPESIFYL